MIDLEKIKRDVKDLCFSLENAFKSLSGRNEESDLAAAKILELKADIEKLKKRKSNFIIDIRVEQTAAQKKKSEYSAVRKEYTKKIEDEKFAYAELLGKHKSEMEVIRMQSLSELKAEQGKVISQTKAMQENLNLMGKEYGTVKENLRKIKEGIPL